MMGGKGGPLTRHVGGAWSMGMFFNLMFGGWELGNAMQGAMSMHPAMLRGMGASDSMAAQAAGINMMKGGIFGAIIGGGAGALDALSLMGGANPKTAASGFGILGKYSPFAFAAAQKEAEQSLNLERTRRAGILAEGVARNDARMMRLQTSSIGASGFRAEMFALEEQSVGYGRNRANESDALLSAMQQARMEGNQPEYDRLNVELGQWKRRTGVLDVAQKGLITAKLQDLQRRKKNAISSAYYRSELMFGDADLVDFENGLFGEDPEVARAMRAERYGAINESTRQMNASAATQRMRNRGQSFAADYATIDESERLALQQAITVGKYDQSAAVRNRANADREAVTLNAIQQSNDIQGDFGARRRALSAQMNGNPVGAAMEGIVGGALNEARGYVRQGNMAAASEALAIGRMQIAASRKDFFRGATMEQTNGLMIGFGNYGGARQLIDQQGAFDAASSRLSMNPQTLSDLKQVADQILASIQLLTN
jgi:hypothetical protein